MTGRLKADRGTGRLAWLDFDAYAARVFANASPDWLSNAAMRIATLERAQSVARSDVVVIDVAAPFQAANLPVSDLFCDQSAVLYLETLLDGAGHRLARQADIVLSLPCPGDLLAAAGIPAAGFDDYDDMAMAASGLLRRLSEKSVAGLCLSFLRPAAVTADELMAIEPLAHIARHYGWHVAALLPGAAAPSPEFLSGVAADLYLCPDCAFEPSADRRIVHGLGGDWWNGRRQVGPDIRFCATVPETIAPETALKRLADLIPSPAQAGGQNA